MAKEVAKKNAPLIDQPDLYQAANNSSESIKANFVIRQEEFTLIIADIKNKKPDDPLQHELILGRRGSGKSTLLKRLQVEIEENKSLSKKIIAINLAEEQAGIYRLFDLWLEVLRELDNKTEHVSIIKDYTDFDNEQEYTRYLYDSIHKILTRERKRAVLLLDNFDRIIENFHDDGNLLREVLLNFNDVQLIAASTRLDEHFWQYDKPFYEFFRRHRLEALPSTEITSLMTHWCKVMNLPQLCAFALQEPGKIEAIRILTDGLPRTLQFFIQLLIHDSTLFGYEYLQRVMDQMTPLYQERLNHLPPSQRKIVLEMAFLWEACSVKQLAEKCMMPSKLLSAQLKNLSDNGIVEMISTSKKNHLYRLSERFFNMWLIMTQGNPEQKRKARWLTIFLENWYNSTQIKDLAFKHLFNLKKQQIPYDKALVLTKAFTQSKHIGIADRDLMLEEIQKLKSISPKSNTSYLPKRIMEQIDEIDTLRKKDNYPGAHKLIDEIENEGDGFKFYLKATLFREERKIKDAKHYYLLSLEKGYSPASYELGKLFYRQGELKKAEQYLLQASEKGHGEASFFLALFYNNVGRLQEAEKLYLLAIDKDETQALSYLAKLYQDQGSFDKAEQYFLQSIDKGDKLSLNDLALLHLRTGRKKEAEQYLLQAMEQGVLVAMSNLSWFFYQHNKNKSQSLDLIQKYNTQAGDKPTAWIQILIEIWNGFFENLEERVTEVIPDMDFNNLLLFLKELLVHEQVNIVSHLFNNARFGKELQKKYSPIHYALQYMTANVPKEVELRIPPELKSTVEKIIAEVKEKQAIYLPKRSQKK